MQPIPRLSRSKPSHQIFSQNVVFRNNYCQSVTIYHHSIIHIYITKLSNNEQSEHHKEDCFECWTLYFLTFAGLEVLWMFVAKCSTFVRF